MAENKINLDEFNMSEAELFAPVSHDEFESERITAPRYSYWKSVFRVFFKKKINIICLSVLALLVLVTYLYPVLSGYDATVDGAHPNELGFSRIAKTVGDVIEKILND